MALVVMCQVSARPFFIGKPGCVRSSACTWLFSSQHSARACSGGDMYRPTMFSSFSTNNGSRETLKPRMRCGFSPLARQCREAGCANAKLSRHLARAPMRGRLGLALSSQLHQSSHIDLDRRRPARQVLFDALDPRLGIAITPPRNLHASDCQPLGDVFVL